MTNTILFANNAATTLAGAISNTATTANLAVGTGALFTPAPSAGQYYVCTLTDAATGLIQEIVHVTAVSGDVVTLVRGQEGTTAQNWLAGDLFDNLNTAGTMNGLLQAANLQSLTGGWAGDTGSVNVLTITLSPVPASYAAIEGAPIRVGVANTNTGAATINVNGLGAVGIVNPNGSNLSPGQLLSGGFATLLYDGTHFQLQSINAPPVTPPINPVSATTAGAYSFTTPANKTMAKITVVGGGGGGAGGSAGQAGGGGGAGGIAILWVPIAAGDTLSGSVGAAGAAGTSGGGTGGTGGNTTIVHNSVTLMTAGGGVGGTFGAAPNGGNGGGLALGTFSGSFLPTNGSYGTDGSPGTNTYGGDGGPGYLGGGGGRGGAGGGEAATGFGAGGGGSYTAAAGAGGAGGVGLVLIEYL